MFRQRTDCIDPGFHKTVSPTVCSETMLHTFEPNGRYLVRRFRMD